MSLCLKGIKLLDFYMSDQFTVTFWGVRGSLPTPGANTQAYGGNTSCVEVRCGDQLFIFDAGTGIRELSNALDDTTHIQLFLSHTHLDHIIGFPFFTPIYDSNCTIDVWAGHLKDDQEIYNTLYKIMSPPIFPIPLDALGSTLNFKSFHAGDTIDAFENVGIKVTTLALPHPDGATAYRVHYQGKSVAYVTDIEHKIGKQNARLVEFLEGADVMIYDSSYDDDEFEQYKGWGHSTWQEGARIADAANVGAYYSFHHKIDASDADLDARADALTVMRDNSFVAKERTTIEL